MSPQTKVDPRKPKNGYCWIGPYNAHSWNFENTECIFCGPNRLAWDDRGHYEPIENGYRAWSVPQVEAAYTTPFTATEGETNANTN